MPASGRDAAYRVGMGDLNPSAVSRLLQGWRPDWTRTVAARRAAAGGLVVLAAVAALRPDPADGHAATVVAARDLSPGAELSAADVIVESHAVTAIPDGALSDPAAAVGSTLTGPTRRGEVITDVRLLGPATGRCRGGPRRENRAPAPRRHGAAGPGSSG